MKVKFSLNKHHYAKPAQATYFENWKRFLHLIYPFFIVDQYYHYKKHPFFYHSYRLFITMVSPAISGIA